MTEAADGLRKERAAAGADPDLKALLSDARLGSDLQPTSAAWQAVPAAGRQRSVLLTGATGFIGAHVLQGLQEARAARVFCLVRASSAMQGAQRIAAALARLELPPLDFSSESLIVVPSDLGRPRLGLSVDQFAELAQAVDTILHCGARIHLTEPYAALRPANVLGTCEVVRLAAIGRPKRVCHLSGISVFLGASEMGENEAAPEPARSRGGYLDSKWVSERIVWEALRRGIPGAVVRLGWISGHSRTGRISDGDALTLFLQACLRLGAAPRFAKEELACAPVDLVAESLVHIALDGPDVIRGYNLCATHVLPFAGIRAACAEAGQPVEVIDRDVWLERLARRLPMLLPVAGSVLKEWDLPPIRNAHAMVVVRDRACTVTAEDLLSAYLPIWRRQRAGGPRVAE